MSSIKITDLKLSYRSYKSKNVDIIVNIPSLELNKGEIVGFFGPNHVGKSTLLKYIAQIHTDFNILKNNILYDNKIYDKVKHKPLIFYVPQDYSSSLFPWFSIKDNLRILLKSLKRSEEEIEIQVAKFCEEFGFHNEEELFKYYGFYKNDIKNEYKIRSVKELSGGQKQILTVIRALLSKPEIIIMDEPFSALDVFKKGTEFRTKVFEYLRNHQTTTLIVAHELEEIIDLTDQLYIFNYHENGEIIAGKEISNVKKSEIEKKADQIKSKYGLNHI